MTKFIFLGRRKILWFLVSGIIIIPSIISLFIWKLPLGIDFIGGASLELAFEKPISEDDLRNKISAVADVKGVQVSKTADGTFLVRVLPITSEKHQEIISTLEKETGKVTEKQYQSVQPSVSKDVTRKAFIAVALASLLIIIYLAISFRGVQKPISSWQFGVTAVIALLHDILITIGFFSFLSHFFAYEVDASFITALLTVMGFSVHDTIVVFDRVRENIISGGKNATIASFITQNYNKNYDFERVVDLSLSQTLNRSIATSLTVIFTLTSLAVLGGESIRPFVITLLIGITIGTYSSIFTASPLLVVWENWKQRRADEKLTK